MKVKKSEEEEEGEGRKMANCLFGGLENVNGGITVIMSNGGIMEFEAPITVGSITDEFPGHSLFNSRDLFWKPLSRHEELFPGKSYYLLPLTGQVEASEQTVLIGNGHIRSNSLPESGLPLYRMSLDQGGRTMKRSYGIWKVKLVISPKQLLEILEEDGSTKELMQSVRTVSKCRSFIGYSDHWSVSSCRS